MAEDNNERKTVEALAKMHIGFVGVGSMAQAIIKGFTSNGIVKANNIWASARTEDTLKKVSQELHVNVTLNNREVVKNSDIVVLSVKPQIMSTVLEDLSSVIDSSKLVVSVAAGLTLDYLESRLSPNCRVVRLMPNTPMLVNAGASVYCMSKAAKPEDGQLIETLFRTVGTCDLLSEHLIDSATGIMGSGPAFIFVAIDAMSDAGVQLGLPRPLAVRLAAQTVYGSGRLVLESGQHPAQLRDAVTSPGGATIAGVRELEMRGFRAAMLCAIEAAATRSKALGTKDA